MDEKEYRYWQSCVLDGPDWDQDEEYYMRERLRAKRRGTVFNSPQSPRLTEFRRRQAYEDRQRVRMDYSNQWPPGVSPEVYQALSTLPPLFLPDSASGVAGPLQLQRQIDKRNQEFLDQIEWLRGLKAPPKSYRS